MVNSEFTSKANEQPDSIVFSRTDMEVAMGEAYTRALPEDETISHRLKTLFGMSTRDGRPLALTYRERSAGGRNLGDAMIMSDNYGGSTVSSKMEAGILGQVALSRAAGTARRGVGPVALVSINVFREDKNNFSVSADFTGLGLKRAEGITAREQSVLAMEAIAEVHDAIERGDDYDFDGLRQRLIARGFKVSPELSAAYDKRMRILRERAGHDADDMEHEENVPA